MSDRALLLSRSDVARFLPLRALASSIGDAYIRHSTDGGAVPRPQRARAQIEDGASVVVNFPGVLAGYDAYTVKVNAKTEANRDVGLPFLRGTILLIERATGGLRAILDSTLVTAMRTAAAGALGVTALARPGASKVALFGAGVQGTWHLGALHAIGRLDEARIFDVEPARAEQLAAELRSSLGVVARAAASATTSPTPIAVPSLIRIMTRPLRGLFRARARRRRWPRPPGDNRARPRPDPATPGRRRRRW